MNKKVKKAKKIKIAKNDKVVKTSQTIEESKVSKKVKKVLDCPVCSVLAEDITFYHYINTKLKDPKTSTKKLEKDFIGRSYAATKHYIDFHQRNCLDNYTPQLTETIKVNNDTIVNNIVEAVEEIDLFKQPDFIAHQKKDFKTKRKEYQDILHYIYIKALKNVAIKDYHKDLGSGLKFINELLRDSYINLLHDSYVDVSQLDEEKNKDIKSSEDLEALSVNLMSLVLENRYLSENTSLTISKLIIKELTDLKMLKQKFDSHTLEEKEELIDNYEAVVNVQNQKKQ